MGGRQRSRWRRWHRCPRTPAGLGGGLGSRALDGRAGWQGLAAGLEGRQLATSSALLMSSCGLTWKPRRETAASPSGGTRVPCAHVLCTPHAEGDWCFWRTRAWAQHCGSNGARQKLLPPRLTSSLLIPALPCCSGSSAPAPSTSPPSASAAVSSAVSPPRGCSSSADRRSWRAGVGLFASSGGRPEPVAAAAADVVDAEPPAAEEGAAAPSAAAARSAEPAGGSASGSAPGCIDLVSMRAHLAR